MVRLGVQVTVKVKKIPIEFPKVCTKFQVSSTRSKSLLHTTLRNLWFSASSLTVVTKNYSLKYELNVQFQVKPLPLNMVKMDSRKLHLPIKYSMNFAGFDPA